MTKSPALDGSMCRTALAFRGYNTENLGRTAELMAEPRYAAVVHERLSQAGRTCAEVLGRPVDLEGRVRRGEEAELEDYAEAVALVFAVELAQVDLLREVHGVEIDSARMSFGYSLGELVSLVVSGKIVAEEVLRVPLEMAADCAALAHDVTMGVLFSRGPAISERDVHAACERLTAAGNDVIAVSAVLSPNTYLVLGQGDTVRGLRRRLGEFFPEPVHLRRNDSRWPPLHTPIVRQLSVPDRAAVLMQTMTIHEPAAAPPVFSLVTGQMIDEKTPIRSLLRDWVDHPQRLWDAVGATLTADVEKVLHLGPAPNVIPATFRRLAENIRQQTVGNDLASWGWIAARQAQRTWLASLLPRSAALLRAQDVEHIIVEDWLLDHADR